MFGLVIALVVVGTSIWVAIDASHVGVKKGCLGGGFADMGPAGWFFSVLLIWIIGFPMYLATRSKYVALKQAGGVTADQAVAPLGNPSLPTGPPAGWYPEPSVPSGLRWWDGRAWGPAAPPTSNRPGA